MTESTRNYKSVISFESVDYSHPNGTIALRNITFELMEGDLVAILGSNGAGKTTLVRHINGLLKPSHGKVTVLGNDTRQVTAANLSKSVGIVFQNANNQLFAQSVRAEIEFALTNFGFSPSVIQRRVDWALNTFSLKEYEYSSPMELSGGEKKRRCIALVLAWEPDIVIFDEPTVGQDSEQKEKLSQIISQLILQKRTVILVTHDIEFIWPLQPKVMLMSRGEIIAEGIAQDILTNEKLTSDSSILPPQLVDFSKRMNFDRPFPIDAFEGESKIRKMFAS